MRDGSAPGVRLVFALDGGRVRHLVAVPPPEPHRELLNFALVVVANKYFRIVADVVVHARGPLPVVLIEKLGLNVVVTPRRVRACIGGVKQTHERLHVRVNTIGAAWSVSGDLIARKDGWIDASRGQA